MDLPYGNFFKSNVAYMFLCFEKVIILLNILKINSYWPIFLLLFYVAILYQMQFKPADNFVASKCI